MRRRGTERYGVRYRASKVLLTLGDVITGANPVARL